MGICSAEEPAPADAEQGRFKEQPGAKGAAAIADNRTTLPQPPSKPAADTAAADKAGGNFSASLLFVCTGNTCRSPMAHYYTLWKAEQLQIQLGQVISRGTNLSRSVATVAEHSIGVLLPARLPAYTCTVAASNSVSFVSLTLIWLDACSY